MAYKVDFKEIADTTDILDVAKLLSSTWSRPRRLSTCDGERALQFFHESNSFQWHGAGDTRQTDCIALYAHIKASACTRLPALKETSEAHRAPNSSFYISNKPEARTAKAQPAPPSRTSTRRLRR